MDRALNESQKDKLHIKKYVVCFFIASGNSFTWKVKFPSIALKDNTIILQLYIP